MRKRKEKYEKMKSIFIFWDNEIKKFCQAIGRKKRWNIILKSILVGKFRKFEENWVKFSKIE